MAIPVEQFTRQLNDSGLMAADELHALLNGLPPERKVDGESLARELVRQKKLTAFQAQQIYHGKDKHLVLGNYRVLDKLGQGGMGMVLKAEHVRMKRLVALKVLSPDVTKSPEALRRFQREVEAAAKLEHPNIVTAHDADEAGGTHFLVMQYVEGTDLSVLLKKNGPLSVEKALHCVLQAAKGLEFAHSRGVVHRDIKPANLLLDQEGTIKILDMGLARLDSAGPQQDQLTGTGQIMGTVDFMAPEQAADTRAADARADIYSLGVSLWYLLTARPLYEGDTVVMKLMAHQQKPIPSLCEACPAVSPDLEAVFAKMVAKAPHDRYQTTTEVIADLEGCRTGDRSSPSFGRSPSGEASHLSLLSGPGGTSAAGVASSSKTAKASPAFEATISLQSPLAGTDPQTQNSLALPVATRPTAQPARKSAGGVRGGWNKLPPVTRIGALAASGAIALLLGIILLLPGKKGTVRIETNDPAIEVVVRETGATIKGATTEDITLTPGEQVFTIKRGDLEFETDMFVLKKGDVVTLRIDLLPDKLQATLGDKPLGSKALRNQPAGNSIAGESAKGWHGWPADAPPPAIAPFDAAQARQHQEAWAAHLGVPVEFENSIGMKFVLIPPGEFTMGSTATEIEAALVAAGGDANWKEHISSEGPRHKVILTQPLYLGVHEVTQPQYEKVMGQNPSHFAPMGAGKDAVVGLDTSSSAVETVSWNDAAEFCAKLSEQEKLKPFYFRSGETVTMLEGTGYRLPTEAEWEFACRAGTTTRYWIGDKDEALPAAGWFGVNSGGRTHAVGELKANPLGLYDIHGNVWEWVQDWWEPTYYGQFREKPALDPDGPSSAGSRRVIRGGSWTYNASNCRASDRYAHGPSLRSLNIGFRLALAVDAVKAAIAKGQASPADAVSGWHGWPADAPRPAIASFDDKQAKQHQEAWAAHLGVPVEFENSIGMQFVLIPPGEFTMGSTAAEIEAALVVAGEDKHWQDCIKSEAPQHKVILTQPLYLSVHEVTQTQYEQVVGQNPSHFSVNGPGKEAVVGLDTSAYPVEMVSWNDSTEFCAKLSEQEKLKPFYFRSGETVTMLSGTGYRLPTEAEWEFSCRAGTTTKYWIGDNDDSLPAAGWFGVNSGGREHAVGELKANPLGLYDIHGNVYEWVQDWWEPTYYSQFQEKPALNQGGPSSAGSRRVIRGGSWYYLASYCRASHRYAADPASRNSGIGFRPALAVDAVKAAIAKEQDSPADAVSGWHGWPADAPRPAIAPFDALQARKHQEEWAAHLGLPVEYTNSIGMKFVLIPPGAFKMGEGDGAVSVTLTRPFRLGVHEVTQGQWQAVMGTEPWKAFRDHQPATQNAAAHITWVEANEFCRKVTETERQAGKIPEDWEYRLPTEAEWEYAARAGTTTRYSFGDDSSQLSEYSWWRDNADAKGEKYAHEVGMFKPNPWGLFDIHGNVYEWCLDAMLGQLPGGFDPLVEPPGLENRVNRGGGWDHRDEFAHTSSNRRGTLQNDRRNNLGLRMVLAQMGETATE